MFFCLKGNSQSKNFGNSFEWVFFFFFVRTCGKSQKKKCCCFFRFQQKCPFLLMTWIKTIAWHFSSPPLFVVFAVLGQQSLWKQSRAHVGIQLQVWKAGIFMIFTNTSMKVISRPAPFKWRSLNRDITNILWLGVDCSWLRVRWSYNLLCFP